MDEFTKKWLDEDGDSTYRLDYNLDEDSLVFDLGGYVGNWSARIFRKYNCNIWIFEPVPAYFRLLEIRFKNNSRIKLFNIAISNSTGTAKIYKDGPASRMNSDNSSLEILRVDFVEFLRENKVKYIDLMKINVEGEEYPILERILQAEENFLSRVANLQIQFHKFVDSYDQRYEKIEESLIKSHFLSWRYPFVWENWRIKK